MLTQKREQAMTKPKATTKAEAPERVWVDLNNEEVIVDIDKFQHKPEDVIEYVRADLAPAGELVSREAVDEVQRRMDEDETILLINAVVDAAVEWHQAGREGAEWFNKAEVLGQSIDALLELRAKVDRAGSSTPTDEDDKGG